MLVMMSLLFRTDGVIAKALVDFRRMATCGKLADVQPWGCRRIGPSEVGNLLDRRLGTRRLAREEGSDSGGSPL